MVGPPGGGGKEGDWGGIGAPGNNNKDRAEKKSSKMKKAFEAFGPIILPLFPPLRPRETRSGGRGVGPSATPRPLPSSRGL